MLIDKNPLVLIRQHFGCLVFDRRTSRYLPFDHEATGLLIALHSNSIDRVLAAIPPGDELDTATQFVSFFYECGFFTLDGRLAATVLNVDVPKDHLVGPLAVHLEIVGACNLTCSHCFAGTLPRNQNPLTVAEMDGLFVNLARLGSFRLGLTGGEPLLRRDLFEILDSATERGLHPCLTTNGLLITEDIARQLGTRELVWLNVSLDGPNAATNDPVRGHGTFDAVLDNLKYLRQHARFTLAFTVMQTKRAPCQAVCRIGISRRRPYRGLSATISCWRRPESPRTNAQFLPVHQRDTQSGQHDPARKRAAGTGRLRARYTGINSRSGSHQPHLWGRRARVFCFRAG